MSPQQVPILAFDAINLAKTMRASFKTAEVAGYFGWAWLSIRLVPKLFCGGAPAPWLLAAHHSSMGASRISRVSE